MICPVCNGTIPSGGFCDDLQCPNPVPTPDVVEGARKSFDPREAGFTLADCGCREDECEGRTDGTCHHPTLEAAPPKPAASLDTNSVADSTGENTGTHGASKEAGGHSRGGLTPVSTLSPKPAPDAVRKVLLEEIITSAMAWQPTENGPSYIEQRADLQAMLNTALSAPVPSPDGAVLYRCRLWMRKINGGGDPDIWMVCNKSDARSVEFHEVIDSTGLNERIERATSATGAAEPVAWRWRHGISEFEWRWIYTTRKPDWPNAVYEPLYTTPPVRGDRETLAEMLKRNGFTSRDGTVIHAGTFGVIDAILSSLHVQPGAGERE